MIWLLLSIFCSTLIFVVFKLFDRYNVSNLQAIVVNYFVAFSVGWLSNGFELDPVNLVHKEWFTSIWVLGVLFISLFQLMALVSQKFGISVVSVTVKMSLVIPVAFGLFLFDESMSLSKGLGITMALAAVYLATRQSDSKGKPPASAILPILLFLGSGLMDSFLKYNQQELVPTHEHSYFASLIFLIAGSLGTLLFVLKWFRGQEKPQWKNLWAGIVLGIPNYGSIYFLLRALDVKGLESSVIFPLNNVGIVAASVITGAVLFNENISRVNKLGIILALLAIGLIALNGIV